METMWVERLVQENGEWVWSPQEESFDLKGDFDVDENNLVGEICRMGQLLVRYGSLTGDQQANLLRKEEGVKLVKASVSAAIRSTAEAEGKKLTENAISEQVVVSSNYQEALSELHVLRADAIKSDHWYRSMVKKADLLNALAFRQNAELKRM